MEENAMILLKTLQKVEGENEENEIELQTKGKFSEKNGKFYVIYEESEMTGFAGTTTTIKITDQEITMTRNGKYNSKMVFRMGDKRLCNYETPYGIIPVGVSPVEMKSNLNDKGGNVYIEYILDIDNEDYFVNRLNMTVTKLVSE